MDAETLGYVVRADGGYRPGDRWFTVTPPDERGHEVVLRATAPADAERVGESTMTALQVRDRRAAHFTLLGPFHPPRTGRFGRDRARQNTRRILAAFEERDGNPNNRLEPD